MTHTHLLDVLHISDRRYKNYPTYWEMVALVRASHENVIRPDTEVLQNVLVTHNLSVGLPNFSNWDWNEAMYYLGIKWEWWVKPTYGFDIDFKGHAARVHAYDHGQEPQNQLPDFNPNLSFVDHRDLYETMSKRRHQMVALRDLCLMKNKKEHPIMTIKLLREIFGFGLKEAKEVFDCFLKHYWENEK